MFYTSEKSKYVKALLFYRRQKHLLEKEEDKLLSVGQYNNGSIIYRDIIMRINQTYYYLLQLLFSTDSTNGSTKNLFCLVSKYFNQSTVI